MFVTPLVGQKRESGVPTHVRFSGFVGDAAGAVGIVFSLYERQSGGAPLWVETQNVQLDAQGRYTVNLGAVNALPSSIFATNEARWLGVQVLADAAPEQARIMLVSVPYALKAQDAETLGGRPASAYLLADAATAPNGSRPAARKGAAAALEVEGAVNADEPHTVNAIPKFSATDTLADSLLFETYNQAAFDAFGVAIKDDGINQRFEDVVRVGDGSGLPKALKIAGRMVSEGFDINSPLTNSVRVVNSHDEGTAIQANATSTAGAFTAGIFASVFSQNGIGLQAWAFEPATPPVPGVDYSYGMLPMNTSPLGAAVYAWQGYDGASGFDFPILEEPVGIFAMVAHPSGIPAVFDQRGTGGGQILSARAAGTEVASMNTDGDFTTTGTITATGGFSGSGAGLTDITASSITDATITAAKLSFDPATQAELDAHKASSDHDARYVLKAGDTMTGTLNLSSNGLVAGTNQLVLSGGNVGIGTATPNMRLRVDNAANQGGLYVSQTNTTSSQTALEVYAAGTASQNALFVGGRVGGAEPFINGLVVKTDGTVGIGTASPSGHKLDVAGTIRAERLYGSSSAKLTLVGYDNGIGGGTGIEFNAVEQGFDFQTHFGSWGSRMVITDAGKVGIGTTSPAQALDVVGNVLASGSVTAASFSGALTGNVTGNVTGSAASFTGSLSGDVTGTQSATTVAKIQNVAVAATSPTAGQALVYDSGTGSWKPTTLNPGVFSRGINYIAGCDSCSLLTTSDSQKTIYVNVVGAMTINEVRCYSDTGTPTINLQRDGSVNTILSADLSCSASGGTTTSFTSGESTLNVNDRVDFYVTGGTGAAHRVTVVIKATVI